jgi:ubiquitin carboxyl-terminal hydrolase 26/29/37
MSKPINTTVNNSTDKENFVPSSEADNTTVETCSQSPPGHQQLSYDDDDEDDFTKACRLSRLEFEKANRRNFELDEFDLDIVEEPTDDLLVSVLEKTERSEILCKNADTGDLPYSYHLMSVVSHIGDTSFTGHYVSDVYDIIKSEWLTFDDLTVTPTTLQQVCSRRQATGYLFFYQSKELVEDLEEFFKDKKRFSFKSLNLAAL